jgi:tetratricopeptide (TPR) repeat protein
VECHRIGDNVHATPGANTILPSYFTQTERSKQAEEFLKNRLEIDLFALRHASPGNPEAWIAPLDTPLSAEPLKEGEKVTLEIVVRNKNIGHNFPSGYEDLKSAWLEVVLSDAKGTPLLVNGVPTSENDQPPKNAHDYRLFALDRAGNPIIRNNRTEQVTTLYRRSIPAGGCDLARYTFVMPKAVRYPLSLKAMLRYRPLRPDFVQWVLGKKAATHLTTTLTLAQAEVLLPSQVTPKPQSPANPKATALRFARYGMALLAPTESPELQRAQRAFRVAQSLSPQEAFPYLGMGSAYLREPDLLNAKREYENALKYDPKNALALLGLGTVAMKQGQFSEALQRLTPLTTAFPNDASLFRVLGTTYYQQGDYEQAVTAFQHALSIDPDDSKTHFQLKLAYQRLQRLLEAHREDTILQYHAEERQGAVLRLEYLRLHPDMQAQVRSLPEHTLIAP